MAARNAIAAGLDGVEVHAANGYLAHQFLDPTVNLRDDEYGGTPEKRARFVIEVVRAVAEAIGADRVGLRISPAHAFNGIGEKPGDDLDATYQALINGVADLGLAYLSILGDPSSKLNADLRSRFGGSILFNTGFSDVTDLASIEQLLEDGAGDAIVVGRQFISNPDLPHRLRQGSELNDLDGEHIYGGDGVGYTDYPTLDAAS